MFLWVPVNSEAVPETNTESWFEEWFQEASVREQEGKTCNMRDTFQNCMSEEGRVGTFNQQLLYPWGQGLSWGVVVGGRAGGLLWCRALSVDLAAGGALASQKQALRIKSRMTHSMSLWGHSAIGFSVSFNVGSSQNTLLVHLWPLTVSSDTNGVTSVGEHPISRFTQWLPSVLRRMGEQWFRKYGGPVFIFLHLSVLCSSFVHIFLIKTESLFFFLSITQFSHLLSKFHCCFLCILYIFLFLKTL